jgi:hypothetical protein
MLFVITARFVEAGLRRNAFVAAILGAAMDMIPFPEKQFPSLKRSPSQCPPQPSSKKFHG